MDLDKNKNDLEDESKLDSYKEAAMSDDYLFGDYDYPKIWIGITTSDI